MSELAVLVATSAAGTAGSTTVTLMTEPTGGSGTVVATLGTITNSALSTSPLLYDLTLGTPIALNASTRYWIELASSGTGLSTAIWNYTVGGDLTGIGVATEFSYNSYNDDGSPGIADASAGLYAMCLSTTANTCVVGQNANSSGSNPTNPAPPPPPSPDQPLPEPATAAILGVALVGLGALRRRRAG